MKATILAIIAGLFLPLFAVAPTGSEAAQREVEPNNSKEEANWITGSVVEGEIAGLGDEDWFVIEGLEGYDVTFTLEYENESCDIDFDVFSDEDIAGSASQKVVPEEVICHIAGTCFVVVKSYDSFGPYTLTITPSEESSRPPDCGGPSEMEPNDTRMTATPVQGMDADIEGYACAGEEDWFVLPGLVQGTYRIRLAVGDESYDVDLDIYSDLSLMNRIEGIKLYDARDCEIVGALYLRAYPHSGEGSYSITIEKLEVEELILAPPRPGQVNGCQGADEVEPNDSRRLVTLAHGDVIHGYACQDEQDWFIVEGLEGEAAVTLSCDSTTCDINLTLFSGRQAIGRLNSGELSQTVELDIPLGCLLCVEVLRGDSAYTISIKRDSGPPEPVPCDGPDEIELNDGKRIATPIAGYTIRGSLCVDDEDWYVIESLGPGVVGVTLAYDPGMGDINAEILSDQDIVCDLSQPIAPDEGEFSLQGRCYVHVFATGGQGAYTIEFSPGGEVIIERSDEEHESIGTSEGTATEIEPNNDMDTANMIEGQRIEGDLSEGDIDWFWLSGQQATDLSITLTYDSSVCDIDLIVQSDEDFVGKLGSSSSPDTGEFHVPGVCYLQVFSAGGEGEYVIEIES